MSGDRPTLAGYLDWARGQGCRVEVAELADAPRLLVTIAAPDGGLVIECLESLDEPLMSTSVARFDRLLRRKSGLFA